MASEIPTPSCPNGLSDFELRADTPLEILRSTITKSIVSAINSAEGSDAPYAHIYIRNLFPTAIYDWMLENPPRFDLFGNSNHRDAQLDDGTSTRKEIVFSRNMLDRLPAAPIPVWQAIYESLQSEAVRVALLERLATDLSSRFNKPAHRLIELENQPRTMFIRDLAGYRIAPHRDVRRKHITMQLYLPANEAQRSLGTSIYRELWGSRTLSWIKRAARILPRAWRHRLYLREARTFPYLPNSGYAFAVSEKSWHGRRTVPNRHPARDSLMHIYYERESSEIHALG